MVDIIEGAERVGERVLEGLRSGADKMVDEVFGPGAAAQGAAEASRFVAATGDAAIAALSALGEGHVHLTAGDITAELTAARTKVEEAIVALARHISGAI